MAASASRAFSAAAELLVDFPKYIVNRIRQQIIFGDANAFESNNVLCQR